MGGGGEGRLRDGRMFCGPPGAEIMLIEIKNEDVEIIHREL